MSATQPLSASRLDLPATGASIDGASRLFKDHLPGLDGLRGIAALIVLLSHVPDGSWGKVFSAVKTRLYFGWFGVDIFFVLSGFLITRILLVDKSKNVPLRYFLARRFLRIFPIYYLTLLVYAMWMAKIGALSGLNLRVLASATFYVSNFFFAAHASEVAGQPHALLLAHTWSLAVEEHFYLVWPFLVYALSYRAAKAFAWCFFVPLAVVSTVLIILHFGPPNPVTNRDPAWEWVYRGTMCRAMSLASGAILAFNEGWLRAHVKRLPGMIAALIATAIAILALRKMFVPDEWHLLARLFAFSMFSTSLVLMVIALRNSPSLLQQVVSNAPLRYVGRISYGIYLYHVLVYHVLGVDDTLPFGSVPWWRVLLAIAATFVVASASFFLIEKPILKLQDRFRAKPQPPATERANRVVLS